MLAATVGLALAVVAMAEGNDIAAKLLLGMTDDDDANGVTDVAVVRTGWWTGDDIGGMSVAAVVTTFVSGSTGGWEESATELSMEVGVGEETVKDENDVMRLLTLDTLGSTG